MDRFACVWHRLSTTDLKRSLNLLEFRIPEVIQIIEYIYANYDVKAAEQAYRVTMEELARAQNALDMVNATIEFDVDFEPMQ